MRRTTASLLLILAVPAWALDFVSALRPAILYDAPSSAADKVAVINAGYPLEKIVTAAGWVKVRDETGKLTWVEESMLTQKRTLLVSVPVAQVLEKPMEGAPVRMRVARGVILDLLPSQEDGWAKVRHASGQEGYLDIREVWGL